MASCSFDAVEFVYISDLFPGEDYAVIGEAIPAAAPRVSG